MLALMVLGSGLNAQAYSSYRASSSMDSGAIRIDLGLMRDDRTSNYNGQAAKDTQINHFNTKAGYVFPSGLYLGGEYEYSTFAFETTNSSTETRSSYGPAIGYFNSGFYVIGTYFITSTYNYPTGNYFSNASAYMVELGYTYNIAGNFNLGAAIVYANYSWNQFTASGVNVTQTNAQTDTYPCLNLGFSF